MCALLSLLAGCAGGPAKVPAPTPSSVPPPPMQAAPEPEPAAPVPPPPATPAAQAQAQKIARAVVDLLEAGKEEEAVADLNRALALDPANKLALNLMRQITADPVAELGRESFSYVVKPSETLSRIAQRFRNDLYAFYILARYNDIKVPRQLSAGQTLRIPGKMPAGGAEPRDPPAPRTATRTPPAAPVAVAAAPVPAPASEKAEALPPPPPAPPPPAVPEPTPAELALRSGEAAERAGQQERALADYRRAAAAGQAGAQARADAVLKRLIDTHTRAARQAFARQDLVGAIAGWDRVLALDPGHDTARSERQKAVELKKRADELPGKVSVGASAPAG
ncbi:hypothetical protein ASF43_00315 [Pseudorhodoferax sp. Leaf267]|nr:hypothetical protein ASF43_00315 [Pseudorhodoferax sp. Leaf267]